MAIKKRKGVNPKEGKSKYGDVNYADETNNKYPLDTAAHVRAAASYFGMPKNRSKYSREDQKKISAKISAAEKKFGIGEHSVPMPEIEIFRAGTHESKSGEKITYTEKNLDEMVETFSADEPPHFIVGHSSDYSGATLIPSYGRIVGGLKRVGDKLVAVGSEFTNKLAEWVKEGFYGERSCEIGRVDGKLKLFAVAMLGAVPAAVKGMQPINQDTIMAGAEYSKPEIALEYASNVDTGIDWEQIEDRAIEKVLEEIQEEFAMCLSNLEDELTQTGEDNDDDPEYMAQTRSNCFSALYGCYDSIVSNLQSHFQLQDGINELEYEDETTEMSTSIKDKIKSLIQYFSKGKNLSNNKQKESDMDEQVKKDYEQKIADLELKNKEFSDARTAAEAKVAEFSDANLKTEIHSFCVANKLDTNKHKEMKIEELMFGVAKANQTLEFSKKGDDGKEVKETKPLLAVLQEFAKSFQISQPPTGEMKEFNAQLPIEKSGTEKRLAQAAEYVKDHPQEFSAFDTQKQKVAHALTLAANSQIKFKE